MLYVFAGLPGSGKSTIAKKLADKIGAVYLRVDSIETAIKNSMIKFDGEIIDAGYRALWEVAKDNLQMNNIVVADSVNPIKITRDEFTKCAQESNSKIINIEVRCSNKIQHQYRVENREIGIKNLKPPTWKDVIDRDYQEFKDDVIKVDTANKTEEESFKELCDLLKL